MKKFIKLLRSIRIECFSSCTIFGHDLEVLSSDKTSITSSSTKYHSRCINCKQEFEYDFNLYDY